MDEWGCIFENRHSGIIGEVKTPIVAGDDEEWVDTTHIHFPEEWLSFDAARADAICLAEQRFVVAPACPRPFEQLQFIRGTEQFFIDLVQRPPKMLAFMQRMHQFYCRLMAAWAKTGVDALMFMDDWGSQRSLLIRPETWAELFKPMYRDYIDIAHSHGKKIFMHSDGYILDILPHLVELGLDAVNAQLFCMGLENLRPYRGKITFWGEIDRQNLLPNATTEEIHATVGQVREALWQNGGCIAQCEFGPGARPENVRAVFEAWNSY